MLISKNNFILTIEKLNNDLNVHIKHYYYILAIILYYCIVLLATKEYSANGKSMEHKEAWMGAIKVAK